MKRGTLYGIGIGPGDPELITLKGARLIGACRNLFVPKARTAAESVALAIARPLVGPGARIEELVFPMTADREELAERWDAAAARIAEVLTAGEDACFLTLGDPLLYSTYIYLLRALRKRLPDLKAVTIPGIMAFGAAAALAEFPIGEGRRPVTIVPAADDLTDVRRALAQGGTVVLMKIGKRLPEVLDLLDGEGLLERSVFVSHAGMATQRIETDLRRLKAEGPEAGYLSVVLVHALKKRRSRMIVHFVGAGPGDPELLTLRAARLLSDCRICVYAGSLVSPGVLTLIPTQAERHDSARMSHDEVVAVYRDAQKREIDVVRLHSGDPSIYGATREQMNALDGLGISYDVCPGVSAFQAAAASLCTELTAPEIAQTIVLTRTAGRTPLPEEQELDRIARTHATLCLFLSAAKIREVAETLSGHYGVDCPAAVVHRASWPEERVIRGTLADIAAKTEDEKIDSTALIIVGKALSRDVPASKLYDPAFSHGFRKASKP